MKRVLAFILAVAIILTGCGSHNNKTDVVNEGIETQIGTDVSDMNAKPEFTRLNDDGLPEYIQNTVYSQLIDDLDSADYYIENVSASYVSQEYIDELEYNSQENIYFGYSLSDLEQQFEGTKYVFTYDESSKNTTVKEFDEYDDTYEKALKNVAIGTGVVLICVTVSVVSGGSAPAVSMIFAAAAKTGTAVASSTGLISGIAAGVVKGVQTGDMDQALKAAVATGSESFKWGAITGAIGGGVGEGVALKGATLNGLTLNEAAKIQKESRLPLDFIKSFHSVDEYNVYKKAKMELAVVNNREALVQKIDWYLKDEEGRTNIERVRNNLSPIDATGKSYELYHIGQKDDSPLAVLTSDEHHKNFSTLHLNTGQEESLINRKNFEKEKRKFWKELCKIQTQ